MSTIESVLQERRVFPPPTDFVKQANVSGMAAYQAMCAEAERDYEGFWARLAREHVLWRKPFSKVLDQSKAPFFKWFHDGELNVSYNCLDRHLESQPNKVAIIFEADDGTVTKITYKQLYHRVCQFANGLKSLGIKCLAHQGVAIQKQHMAGGRIERARVAPNKQLLRLAVEGPCVRTGLIRQVAPDHEQEVTTVWQELRESMRSFLAGRVQFGDRRDYSGGRRNPQNASNRRGK